MNGVFAINKPSGPTSRDVVDKLKFVLSKQPAFLNTIQDRASKNQASHRRARQRNNYIKIGHGGTLDPLADGVLVIGVGTGTRSLSDYLGKCRKTYLATAMFGVSTTTYDSEGKILEYGPTSHLTKESISEVLKSKFSGDILQTPPVYSALKMNGKPLYEYARNNEPLPKEVKPRECRIDRIEVKGDLSAEHKFSIPQENASEEELNMAKQLKNLSGKEEPSTADGPGTSPEKFPVISIEFSVSSGTYIRSLIHDIGLELGTAAHMVALTRLSQGEWELENNVLELSEILDQDPLNWMPVLKTVLKEGPKVSIDAAKSLSGVDAKKNAEMESQEKGIEKSAEKSIEKSTEKSTEESSRNDSSEKSTENDTAKEMKKETTKATDAESASSI